MDVEGKVAVVTGASSGIGRAIALALARAGADLVLAARGEAGLEDVRREIAAAGRRALVVRADVSRLADVQELGRRAIGEMGRVDILVNNAGVHMIGPLENVSIDDWEWIVGANLWSVIYGVNVFLPHMLARGSGHIVNTASVAGLIGGADPSVPYTTTKFAVQGFSEALAVNVRRRGIGVSVLCPGLVATNIASRQRLIPTGQPELDAIRRAMLERVKSGDWSFAEGTVLQPEVVADLVVQAIGENTFLIPTHPFTKEMVLYRAQDPEGCIERLVQNLEAQEQRYRALGTQSDGQ